MLYPSLSPSGAAILASHADGFVVGHSASVARLVADRLVAVLPDGRRRMTPLGHATLAAQRSEGASGLQRLVVVSAQGPWMYADSNGTDGARYRAMRRAAAALIAVVESAHVLLLAGRNGLVPPENPPAPDAGRRGPTVRPPSFLRRQAEQLGVLDAEVIVLGDASDSNTLRRVFPDCVTPLAEVEFAGTEAACNRITGDRELQAIWWAETARQRQRGVNAETCQGCCLCHGNVRVSELLPGDSIEIKGHALLVRGRPKHRRVRLAGGTTGAPRSVDLDPYTLVGVRRPLRPFKPSHHSESLGREVDAFPPHPCDCGCLSCQILRSAAGYRTI